MDKLTLKQLRLIKGYSAKSMAEALNVHENTYLSWEKKPSNIKIEMAYKICSILEIDYDREIFLP